MKTVSAEVKAHSINSFQSTIRKLEKALAQMNEKGANTSLIEKRLQALHIGLAVLNKAWHEEPHSFNQEELTAARNVLLNLLPSLKKVYANSKIGSSQQTLLERRIASLELAIAAIDDQSGT